MILYPQSPIRYSQKSVSVPEVRFGTQRVRFGIHESPFRSVPVHFGPFRSVSVNRDTVIKGQNR